jgi:glycosyltransferase involved in cell wall biosynthesis
VAHWVVPSAWPVSISEHTPLELVSHGADVRLLQAMPAPVRERVVRALIERAERWRFVAEHLRDGLAGSLPPALAAEVLRLASIDPAPIDVPDVRAEAVHKRALMGPLPFATCVGRLVASKRVDLAIATAAREGLRLVVVGDGPDRDRLERLAKREGALVRFVGLVDRTEALAWLAASDELFFASEAEGLSTVLREAEALGVVVRTLHE